MGLKKKKKFPLTHVKSCPDGHFRISILQISCVSGLEKDAGNSSSFEPGCLLTQLANYTNYMTVARVASS